MSNHELFRLAEAMNLIQLRWQGWRSRPSVQARKPWIHCPLLSNSLQVSYCGTQISSFSFLSRHRDRIKGRWGAAEAGATRRFVPAWCISLQQRYERSPYRPTAGGHLAGCQAEAKASRAQVGFFVDINIFYSWSYSFWAHPLQGLRKRLHQGNLGISLHPIHRQPFLFQVFER